MRQIQLDPNGEQPEISVFFGQAQYGEYRVSLRCKRQAPREVQGEGDNVDDEKDRFPLKRPLAKLDKCVLSWSLVIAAPKAGEGQRYYARIEVIQGDHVVETIDYGDSFSNTKNIVDAAILRV